MKRLFTILLVAVAVAVAVAYPLAPRVQASVWAVLLTGAAPWVLFQKDRKAQLWLPCVIASFLLALAGGIIAGDREAAFAFLLSGFFCLKGGQKLFSQFDWEVMLGTAGAAVLSLLALIELLR